MAKKKPDAPAKKSDSKPAATGAAPVIDTKLAANTAAALVASKAAQPAAPKKESAAFKQLKAGLNKPAVSGLGAFSPVVQTKKSNQPFAGGKQVGHNQTIGNDATRSGVPRRTAG